ncbi:hypothetical protein COI41_20850 [Bacillus toyonensis]|uniref:putative cyclic bacteriocin n=1 Tax=Bacillus toyonensis TaxID=155322 RepID=UPI000BF13D24|nr:putative cyclic bacteriocin [Bacillus toyonensis]PEO56546.1 hypothetical protein CN567_29190 [Bacillus toyonensis]PFX76435.1 hypothetical protein COL38_28205 [Bacillus toyonensis]PFX77946.1 hypothetical protein COL37_25235 [Bacillus toyonensis]PGB05118.1 hypothetical protein COL98_27950 [Bacillus toyonensis]PHF52548.1 hypothetical protein COI41_20850 [Bacillus toyonensis]
MLFNVVSKLGWTGISIGTATTFINALVAGSDIWTAISVAGIAFGGGIGTAISTIGRKAIIEVVEQVGKKKAAQW